MRCLRGEQRLFSLAQFSYRRSVQVSDTEAESIAQFREGSLGFWRDTEITSQRASPQRVIVFGKPTSCYILKVESKQVTGNADVW